MCRWPQPLLDILTGTNDLVAENLFVRRAAVGVIASMAADLVPGVL